MALCYDGQLIRTYNDSKARFAIRDSKLRFLAISCDSAQSVMLRITEYTYDSCAASISDRNLSSVRMTVNARRLCFTANITSDSRFQSLALARSVSYGILRIPRDISYRNDGFNNTGMRQSANRYCLMPLLGLGDFTFPPSRRFRRSLFRGVPQ